MKRWIVIGASLLVYAVDGIWRLLCRLIGRRLPGRCVVLMYHEVPSDLRERFAQQMDLARRLATPLPADWRHSLEAFQRYFVVTFDDGLSSVADNALPVLEARSIPATVFVVTGSWGEVPAWKSGGSGRGWAFNERSRDRMLGRDQVRNLAGKVQVGSHSVTHPKFSEIDERQARFELEASRRELSGILGTDVGLFSFPYGIPSSEAVAYCRDAGYERVFTNSPVCALSNPDEFVSGRVSVDPREGDLEFRLKVLGAYRWLPVAFALKRSLRRALGSQAPFVHAKEDA